MTTFGLSSETLAAIIHVFASTEKIDRVRIFGSRTLGRYRQGSDIDLAIEGVGIDLNYSLEIRLKLENLMLPYRFDVVNFSELAENDSLREHINRVGQVIFERAAQLI